MRITVIGTGYVGLVSGVCFSEFGFHVTCVDKLSGKIDSLKQGIIPIYEPGLDRLVEKNTKAGRLEFTTDLKTAVAQADVVFIAVGTPSRRGDGHADLSYVFSAAEEIADALNGYTVVVTKSTVPVGTGRRIEATIRERRPDAEFDIASNPEFLREGSAIDDFMRPDRVVVGAEGDKAQDVMRQLYRPLFVNETPILFTGIETAELIKYAANTFLATKITFINEMADLCEKLGANVQDVARGMGMDKRIGNKFLDAGPGYGGSCFPKDTLALVKIAQDAGSPCTIVESVVEANANRKKAMINKVVSACGGSVSGKKIAVLGLTFKPDTDDMRDSPSLVIVPGLVEQGATVHVHDPEGMEEARKLMPQSEITWCERMYETMAGAEALVIITEWNKFRSLDFIQIKSLLKSPTIIDLRNIYDPQDMKDRGFNYTSIGR